jgi:hypothetical protein
MKVVGMEEGWTRFRQAAAPRERERGSRGLQGRATKIFILPKQPSMKSYFQGINNLFEEITNDEITGLLAL